MVIEGTVVVRKEELKVGQVVFAKPNTGFIVEVREMAQVLGGHLWRCRFLDKREDTYRWVSVLVVFLSVCSYLVIAAPWPLSLLTGKGVADPYP
jgi:hypothetical protein